TVTTLFFYGHTGYEVIALSSIFLFGWLVERRHGPWAPLLVFLLGGAAGNFLAIAGDDVGIFTAGGNGAALALLAAWAMRDVLGRRRGIEDESDLLGALAISVARSGATAASRPPDVIASVTSRRSGSTTPPSNRANVAASARLRREPPASAASVSSSSSTPLIAGTAAASISAATPLAA